MRIALLGDVRRIPWLPLSSGILRGFRRLGDDARSFHTGECSWLAAEELLDFEPELTLVMAYCADVAAVLPMLELAQRTGPSVVIAADDPYDHRSGLELGAKCEGVFTFERGCLPHYEAAGVRAWHVHPWSDDVLHAPAPPGPRDVDLAWIGCRDFQPRDLLLRNVQTWLSNHGRTYGEACGKNRWLAGRELSQVLGRSRILLDIPRHELATITNPHQVRCTYTAPRVHLAAATGCFVAVLGPRPDLAAVYPSVPSAPLEGAIELLDTWLLQADDDDREEVALENRATFLERFSPEFAARRMLDELVAAEVLIEGF